jgi:uncharacterized protein YjbJ (UPF0337 family)
MIRKFLETNMILFHQIRKVLTTIGLVVFLTTVITFSSAPGESWAIPLFTTSIDQPYVSVVTMNQAKAMVKNEAKNVEGKAQEGIGNMTGDLKNQAAGKAKQFDANTQKSILESIDNPDYQPSGNMRKRSREAVECLEDDVRDCFEQK